MTLPYHRGPAASAKDRPRRTPRARVSPEALALALREWPAALALLSPLGQRAALPFGIPQQSAEAAACERRATIGQITDGAGVPLPLPSLHHHFADLDPRESLLYTPQHGLPRLRQRWKEHVLGSLGQDTPVSLPVVTAGITHAISICGELFTAPDRPLLLPLPYWDNYDTIVTMRTGAPIRTFPFFDGDPLSPGQHRFNTAGLRAALARLDGPATLLLNFPANPTGYSPLADEVPGIVQAIAEHPHPLAVICDDAYETLFFEPDMYGRSIFGALARAADPRRHVICKVDGATKELVFFGGRVGFLTFAVPGAAGDALAEKAAALIRSTISSGPAPAQSAVLAALESPTLAAEQAAVVGVLAGRYRALKAALDHHGVPYYPFNSGCFCLLPLREGLNAEVVRKRLITEQSVGVIQIPQVNALRVAFCGIEERDIPDLVARLARVIG